MMWVIAGHGFVAMEQLPLINYSTIANVSTYENSWILIKFGFTVLEPNENPVYAVSTNSSRHFLLSVWVSTELRVLEKCC